MLSLQRQHNLSEGWKYRLRPLHTQSSFRLEPCSPTEPSARVRMFRIHTVQHGGHSLCVSAQHLKCVWLIKKLNSNQFGKRNISKQQQSFTEFLLCFMGFINTLWFYQPPVGLSIKSSCNECLFLPL